MLGFFYRFYTYFQVFTSFILFFYIYKYFFDRCNERIFIKNKESNKKKHVIKSRIVLSLIYFTMILSIYMLASLRVLVTLFFGISLGFLLAFDKFSPESLNYVDVLDKNKSVRFVWKVFYTVINLIFMVLHPVHKEMNKGFTKKYLHYKNKITELFINDNASIDQNFMNLFKNFNFMTKTSEISDYIIKKKDNSKINLEKNNQDFSTVKQKKKKII